MQPSHLPFAWLKTIERFIVQKQLLPSRDKITYVLFLLPSGVKTHSHSSTNVSSLPDAQKTRLHRYSTSGKPLIAKSDAPWQQFLALISDRLNTQITASGITDPKALALKKDISVYTQSRDRQQEIKNMGGIFFLRSPLTTLKLPTLGNRWEKTWLFWVLFCQNICGKARHKKIFPAPLAGELLVFPALLPTVNAWKINATLHKRQNFCYSI